MINQNPKKEKKAPVKAGADTSWNAVAGWYDTMIEKDDDTYQTKVILPNIVRAMGIKEGTKVLDVACGQGFFSRAFRAAGAEVSGVDVATTLIDFAKKQSPKEIRFFVRSAEDLVVFQDGYFDKVVVVLAIQNIEAPHKVFKECVRVLAPGGKLYLVMNHPAFRIPKASAWGFDDEAKTQYRRVDRYMSESKSEIDMNPGRPSGKRGATTISFHRPLQYYFKTLANSGFAVARLEEWLSHRVSEKGPRQDAEDRARKEIPLFLFLEAEKRGK
ncbi:MAG: class I SAM-dependent methyltransferase [Patescibacteria group bacterium]